jgi:hypothetical protein
MASAVAWSWRNALHGAVLAAPAAIAMVADPIGGLTTGLTLAVGVLPAAGLGVAATRRQRARSLVVGAIAAASILTGSVIGRMPVLAVCTIFVLCVVVALLTADRSRKLATPVLVLGLPLIGVGLSFSSVGAGAGAALLILAGTVYAFLVSLVWPARASAMHPGVPPATRGAMLVYGIQIGLAGALAAAAGFALHVDHPGWACVAALMVSRPAHAALVARGWGRALSVLVGAVLALAVAALSPPDAVFAVFLVIVLAAATGTAGSRWYVFPLFSTVIVLSLLMGPDRAEPAHWFLERLGMTLLGVGLALAAASVVPRIAAQLRSS